MEIRSTSEKIGRIIISPSVNVVAYDLEQILPTPYLTSNVAFYMRQLSTFNIGHNITYGVCITYGMKAWQAEVTTRSIPVYSDTV